MRPPGFRFWPTYYASTFASHLASAVFRSATVCCLAFFANGTAVAAEFEIDAFSAAFTGQLQGDSDGLPFGDGDSDTYTFTARGGDRLLVTLAATDGAFIPRLEILESNDSMRGQFNAADTNDTASENAYFRPRNRPPETYRLVVKNNCNCLGSYRLDFTLVSIDNDATPPPGDPLENGTLQRGEVLDYRFEAMAGDRVVATLNDVDREQGDGTFSPRLELLGPDGDVVCADEELIGDSDQCANEDSDLALIEKSLVVDGIYTLLVSDNSFNEAGNYRLDFSRVPGANDGGTLPLPDNAPVESSLAIGEVLAYQFTANADDRLLATLSDTGDDGFRPRLDVVNPDGTRIFSDADASLVEVTEPLATAGIYTLLVSDNNYDAPGSFRLDFELDGPIDGGIVDNGPAIEASLLTGEVILYRFDATAGDRLVVTLTDVAATNFRPRLDLLGSDGTELSTDNNADAALLDQTLATTGSYTVVVRDNGDDEPGSYRLDFSLLPGANDGGTLDNAVSDTRALLPGEVLAYQFAAAAGDHVVITLAETVPGSPYVPNLQLLRPDGSTLRADVGSISAFVNTALGAAGTYTLLVRADNPSVPGEFRLDFSRVPGAADGGILQNAGQASGELLVGEVKAFQFSASSGDQLVAISDDGGSSGTTVLELYGPAGEAIASDGLAAGEVLATLAASGVHTLLLSDANYDTAGQFVLSLNGLATPNDDADGDLLSDANDNCPGDFNPAQLDTDSDGAGNVCDDDDDNDRLPDAEEAELGTDPLRADSDGDGFNDSDEVDAGSDPLDGADEPLPSGLSIIIIKAALDL